MDCAYGAGTLYDNGVGMVEDVFTLPDFRRGGIATAIIAHATEPPKRLYAARRFSPVYVTREYIKYMDRRAA